MMRRSWAPTAAQPLLQSVQQPMRPVCGAMRKARVVQAAGAQWTAPAGSGHKTVRLMDAADSTLDRRHLILSSLLTAGACVAGAPGHALAASQPAVGNYLPPATVPGYDFVLFVPDKQKTPAIRAGTVDPSNPYRIALPRTWKEDKVANIQSGNYCQPRCAEPWTEVIFSNEAEGRLQVIVSPLVRLTNVKGVSIQDIGTPQGLLVSLGAFITGTYLDDESIESASSVVRDDGRTYYTYEINQPGGAVGPHTVSSVTVKGDLALLCVVSANDKQWSRNADALRAVAASFRA